MEIVIAILIGMNVVQLVFWSRQTQKLVDKLMSRNYAEYVQVNKPNLPTAKVENVSSHEETEILDHLNGMFS